MFLKKYFLYFLPVLLLLSLPLRAQTDITAYSSQGLGKLASPALVHNLGMGGVGIAAGSGLHINNMNPALLYRNNLTSFDLAFATAYKDIMNDNETTSSVTGGLSYGIFAFPAIANRWTFSVGLMPFSTVGYKVQESRAVIGNNQASQLELEGDGGISQVYWSHGVRIYKNLSAGIKMAYLFGSISRDLNLLPLTSDDFSYQVSYKRDLFYSGLLPEAGLHYSLKTGKTTYLSAGIIYQPETQVKVIRNETFESKNVQNDLISQDTVANDPGAALIPQKIGFGVALEKYMKYTVGVDITLQQWEKFGVYKPENVNTAWDNDGLKNSMEIAAGGEFIPDVSSVSSYLKRVTYRLGFNYRNTPFFLNEKQITDLSVNFGFSLPVSNLSSVNLAFEAGRRGTTTKNLIQENYFKINLGTSFNDRWFVRRKYD